MPVQSGLLQAQQPVDIVINYTGDPSFQPLFNNAETIWESILPSYKDGVLTVGPGQGPGSQQAIGPLVIDAGVFDIDGVNGTLAQAGPTSGFQDDSGFVLAQTGQLEFDINDIDTLASAGNLQDIIVHELGHVLGFGTLWELNNVYNDTTSSTSVGQYVGTKGVQVYNEEFGLNETFIPIENNGGEGTADGHFDEEFFGVALNGSTTVATGTRFGPNQGELLTGFFNSNVSTFISDTTAATFHDIGFNVDFDALAAVNGEVVVVVPEPSSAAVLLLSFGMLGCRRRRNLSA